MRWIAYFVLKQSPNELFGEETSFLRGTSSSFPAVDFRSTVQLLQEGPVSQDFASTKRDYKYTRAFVVVAVRRGIVYLGGLADETGQATYELPSANLSYIPYLCVKSASIALAAI